MSVSRDGRTAVLLALVLLAPVAARAQAPSPAPPTPESTPGPTAAPSPEPTGPALPLSLDETVKRALDSNVDIAVERFNPEASEQNINELRGAYDPFLSSAFSQVSTQRPGRSTFEGAGGISNNTTTFNVGASKLFATGGNLQVGFNNNRANTDPVGLSTTFNPLFSSTFSASLTQPLLRNFRLDATRLQIRVAKKNREISDVQFHQTVVNTVASVKQLYYDYLYAIDNLEAQRKSLDLAQRLVDENRIRVRVGTLAPLDVVAAESEQASREEAVIVAEAALFDAEDALKRAIFPSNDPVLWAQHIVPTDRPTADPVKVDTEAAMRNALQQRTDIVAARKSLESAGLNLEYASNQKLPGLDLVAAYGANGIGGTQLLRANPIGPVTGTVPGGVNDALSSIFGRDFPTWTLGVNVSYPLFNHQAEAAAARARISLDQSEAGLRRLEMQVATEVRSAARAVESNYKRVESTRAARVLQEQRLDAEQKKFAAGMSTNFLVTQAQRDLTLADVAELRAVADYRKSLVNFDRVQEAGTSGVTFASPAAAARTTATAVRAGTTTGQQ